MRLCNGSQPREQGATPSLSRDPNLTFILALTLSLSLTLPCILPLTVIPDPNPTLTLTLTGTAAGRLTHCR